MPLASIFNARRDEKKNETFREDTSDPELEAKEKIRQKIVTACASASTSASSPASSISLFASSLKRRTEPSKTSSLPNHEIERTAEQIQEDIDRVTLPYNVFKLPDGYIRPEFQVLRPRYFAEDEECKTRTDIQFMIRNVCYETERSYRPFFDKKKKSSPTSHHEASSSDAKEIPSFPKGPYDYTIYHNKKMYKKQPLVGELIIFSEAI
jgi:hypothetical protein